jgi:hypothetical protein
MVETLPELAPFAAPQPDERSWCGYLTVENAGHIAARLESMLAGRRFTVVRWYERRQAEPEVETGCRLDARARTSGRLVDWEAGPRDWSFGSSVYHSEDAHIGFSAGSYSYGFNSVLKHQPPWFWLEPDEDMARKLHARGEGEYLDARGYHHGPARGVLEYIDAAVDADQSTQVVFEGDTVRFAQRAPIEWTSVTIRLERELRYTRALIEAARALSLSERGEGYGLPELIENAEWELNG